MATLPRELVILGVGRILSTSLDDEFPTTPEAAHRPPAKESSDSNQQNYVPLRHVVHAFLRFF
jgi:hypothetical protein